MPETIPHYKPSQPIPDGLYSPQTLHRMEPPRKPAPGAQPQATYTYHGNQTGLLYRLEDTVPKRVMTEAQRAVLGRARELAYVCRWCGYQHYEPLGRGRVCHKCWYLLDAYSRHLQARHILLGGYDAPSRLPAYAAAIEWVPEQLAEGETPNPYERHPARIVVVDDSGKTVFDRLFPASKDDPSFGRVLEDIHHLWEQHVILVWRAPTLRVPLRQVDYTFADWHAAGPQHWQHGDPYFPGFTPVWEEPFGVPDLEQTARQLLLIARAMGSGQMEPPDPVWTRCGITVEQLNEVAYIHVGRELRQAFRLPDPPPRRRKAAKTR